MQYQFLIAPKKSATSKSVSEDEPGTSSLTRRVSIGVSGKREFLEGMPQSRYFPLPQTLSLG